MTCLAGRRQRGAAAVETALLLPVLLTGLMMLFEVARLALLLIVGNLALESALSGLRRDTDLRLTDDSAVADRVKERMLTASYGYLEADGIEVTVVSYADLASFGAALSGTEQDAAEDEEDGESGNGLPVLTVEVALAEEWITALPSLLGLDGTFSHTYRQVLGNLYRPEEAS
jgi:TadE-like protein.